MFKISDSFALDCCTLKYDCTTHASQTTLVAVQPFRQHVTLLAKIETPAPYAQKRHKVKNAPEKNEMRP
jgi:hypothetical protein